MGNTLFNPARDGHALDRLRHADPKIARKLRGVGSRAKQYATLQEEGIMGTAVSRTEQARQRRGLRSITVDMAEETKARYMALRGTQTHATFLATLLTHYEQRQTGAGVTTEVAHILADLQAKLGLPTQLETVKRLMEVQATAARRAETIKNLKEQRDGFKRDLDEVTAQRDSQYDELCKAVLDTPQARVEWEGQGIVLDLLDTLAGATATLDPSGEIIVRDLPAGAERKLFGLWQRGVAALGIRKREG